MSPETRTDDLRPEVRARLITPDDQPDYETLVDLTERQKAALPARFHTPRWVDAIPGAFVCAVCWGDGWCTSWPCATAVERGAEVFDL